MTDKLKSLTGRNRGREFETVIREVNAFLRGWLNYYGLASARVWLTETEAWLRRRLRCYRLKQCKRRFAIAKFLMKSGLPERRAWLLAMSNKWFAEMGLIPLVSPVGGNRVVP